MAGVEVSKEQEVEGESERGEWASCHPGQVPSITSSDLRDIICLMIK